ncbi:signal peptidase I [Cellulosimicrobium cellulans]|uniref:signal peptidase I n=1 Tax=Cellulosimicrobium cellulans TaxID=1710 RepID=UPI00130DFB51|nr:signal peptidase I [Cellulosimicrobium cellulans]
MRTLRTAGHVALWLVAALGLVSLLAWGATRAGWIQPLVVVSGSMEPAIGTGDLLVAVPRPTADLRVGDVATLRSSTTGVLVTHRVVAVERTPGDGWTVRMQGDANASPDASAYPVGDTVWQPVARLAGAGRVVTTLTRPGVAAPLGVALAALVGLSALPAGRVAEGRAAVAP